MNRREFLELGAWTVVAAGCREILPLQERFAPHRFVCRIQRYGESEWQWFSAPIYDYDPETFDVLQYDLPKPCHLENSRVETDWNPGVNIDEYAECIDALYLDEGSYHLDTPEGWTGSHLVRL